LSYITTILQTRQAGPDHQVVTVQGGHGSYRREPCADCPWKVSSNGIFPPEAFRHSASTAYDMATHEFGCHQSGNTRPATCAGFLLNGAMHSMAVRIGFLKGRYQDDVTDGGHELHQSYRDMAIANGVDQDDPVLKPCR